MDEFRLVWSDEFDYEGQPNPDKWILETGGHGFGNNESQYYTNRSDNAYVKDGKLVIVAKKEDYKENQYTSAKLTTYNKQSWQYGKIAIRAKLPKGKGTWPAIWMLSDAFMQNKGWPLCGEIDIMEHLGRDQDVIHFSLHSKKYNHREDNQITKFEHIKDVSDQFYEYSLEWTPEYLEFFVNDTAYAKFEKGSKTGETEWPFDQPFHLILNIAIGGYWGGEIDDTIFPQKMVIDYVKVYEKC